MPGKVNPTQCEALTMVCAQVHGQRRGDRTSAGASGNFELNVYKPLIVYNLLQSIRLLADACRLVPRALRRGHRAEPRAHPRSIVKNSLMLVTALTPHIGYDLAAAIAKQAHAAGTTLRDAALSSGTSPPRSSTGSCGPSTW